MVSQRKPLLIKIRPGNVTLPRPATLLNATDPTYPEDPPGLAIILKTKRDQKLDVIEFYLAAIDVVEDLAENGWDNFVPSGTYTKRFTGIDVQLSSFVKSKGKNHLRSGYLILGILHLSEKMTRSKRFCVASASIVAEYQLGQVDILAPQSSNRITTTSNATNATDPTSNLLQSQSLKASRRIIDPDDSDFVITYVLNEVTIPCMEFLSTTLNALATAAQAHATDRCPRSGPSFAGLDPWHKVE